MSPHAPPPAPVEDPPQHEDVEIWRGDVRVDLRAIRVAAIRSLRRAVGTRHLSLPARADVVDRFLGDAAWLAARRGASLRSLLAGLRAIAAAEAGQAHGRRARLDPYGGEFVYLWLLDEKGRRRANIFYKPQRYDRDAFMSVMTRFSIDRAWANGYDGIAWEVRDQEVVLYRTVPRPDPTRVDGRIRSDLVMKAFHAASDAAREISEKESKKAVAWLDARFPEWRDPACYWDVEAQTPEETLPPLLSDAEREAIQAQVEAVQATIPALAEAAKRRVIRKVEQGDEEGDPTVVYDAWACGWTRRGLWPSRYEEVLDEAAVAARQEAVDRVARLQRLLAATAT